ncbi:MAG: DUF4097 family beta strand repeat-containing protein [Marinoscillum sp.]
MKRINTMLMLTLIAVASYAQEYKYTPKGDVSNITVLIENLFADVVIEGVNSNEITITTSDYEGIPEKAQGLKPLSATGPENTGIGLSVIQEGNTIKISGASRKANGDYYIKLPKNIKLKADMNHWQAGDFVATGLTNDVEVKSQNSDLVLKNITGPLVAYSLSADIEVVFTSLSQTTPTSISTTSGDLDITIPATTKGNFKLGTVSGEIYTDIDFKFNNSDEMKRLGGGMKADASLNGGGVDIALKSVSGDVFIRKAK